MFYNYSINAVILKSHGQWPAGVLGVGIAKMKIAPLANASGAALRSNTTDPFTRLLHQKV
jgi:hypothetical protein